MFWFYVGLGEKRTLDKVAEHFNVPLWMIKDIGGNIHEARILDRDLIAVGYDKKADFKKGEFISGLAVIRWKTGEILFNRTARFEKDKKDFWYPRLKYLNLLVEEDGSLLFYGDGEALRLPKEKADGWKWNEDKAIKLKADPPERVAGAEGNKAVKVEVNERYAVIICGNSIRVEKRRWVIE